MAAPPAHYSLVDDNWQEYACSQYSNQNYLDSASAILISLPDGVKVSIALSLISISSFHLVNRTFTERLDGLTAYEIVFICDHSNSINAPLGKSLVCRLICVLVVCSFRKGS